MEKAPNWLIKQALYGMEGEISNSLRPAGKERFASFNRPCVVPN
jgi:hypothetical protein